MNQVDCKRVGGTFAGTHTMAESFPQTRWSLVERAKDGEEVRARQALADLCREYWQPLHAFVRRSGYPPEDAKDLTQEFFRFLIEKGVIGKADQDRGRLRSFLLRSLKNFMTDEMAKRQALKRGGGMIEVRIDAPVTGDHGLDLESRELSPDDAFDRQWAHRLMERVFEETKRIYQEMKQEELFEALHPFLVPQGRGEAYRTAGERLGMKGSAVRVAVFRMRHRYAECLRQVILETVAAADDVGDEINHLFRALQ